jgi:hypothetical protein
VAHFAVKIDEERVRNDDDGIELGMANKIEKHKIVMMKVSAAKIKANTAQMNNNRNK